MTGLSVTKSALPEVLILEPKRFGDARGFFTESYSRRAFAEATGLDLEFVQDNHSFSAEQGVVRGLHAQKPPAAQDKLIRVAGGRILDVAVDIRRGSPNFGKHVTVELSAENGRQLLVPKGFLHGFATLTPACHVLYKTSDYYAPADEVALRWNDPDIAIEWGLPAEAATVSAKDAEAPFWGAFASPFTYEEG